ncbi:hypothetical protein BIT28_27215 [Photobacterium proteolyticum]|uniref:DUF4870 domain-containing protein n=1 Tax=Photobacterium proteolyticum TaxID=1903952 RepID=A0A1Q9G8B1_9GAMM|nr:hypothetical protein [Photobacterium proteolyticum]OLQ70511.1 hypothetical protein BIT28_27215 [Photobacterium proteolyticum]
MSSDTKSGVRFAYIASFLTPLTFMISGIVAVIYSAYKLNKGTDELTYSHYYTIIRTFFLFFTFFVVLGVTAATTSGMVAGAEYWVQSDFLDKLLSAIPVVGLVIAALAIVKWFVKHIQGMKLLSQNKAIEL